MLKSIVFCSLLSLQPLSAQSASISLQYDPWQRIDLLIDNIENENKNMSEQLNSSNQRIEKLQKQFSELETAAQKLETAYKDNLIQYQNLEIQYQKSEENTKRWKITSAGLAIALVTSVVINLLR